MIRLHTLGAVDLRDGDGNIVRSVLAQPRRLALLIYLAAASPRGAQRRDSLLSLFWAEQDASRARNALGQALFFLRRSLGSDLVVSTGEGSVALHEERVWCDAVEFERLLEADRFREALDLYRGDFLQGFHLSDAPDWERWVDARREWLRKRATQAAWALAEERAEHGDHAGAVEWWRWLSAHDPHSTRIALRLMQALAASGDTAAALKHAQTHTELLEVEFDLPPDPQVLALAEQLRTPPPAYPSLAPEHPPASAHAAPEPDGADAPPAPAGERLQAAEPAAALSAGEPGPAPRSGQGWRGRRWSIGILLPLAVLALGLAAWALWERLPGRAVISPARVAIFPFVYRGSPEFTYLGDGVVDLLGTNLDGAGELRVVDSHALLTSLERQQIHLVDPAAGSSIARRFEAGLFVTGEIVEVERQLRIRGALHDVGRPAEPLVRAAVEGSAADLFRLVDELTVQLLAGRLAEPGAQLARSAVLTTSSIPALRAYLEGETHFRAHRFSAALEAFGEAVAQDSSFALAYYRKSVAADWAHEYDLAARAALQAGRFRDRLSERHRLLVEGLLAWQQVQIDEAEQIYRTVLARYPDDVEAWYRLGEVFFHYNPLRGRPVDEAREPFERAAALDPAHPGAFAHLAHLAARQGARADLDRYVEALLRLSPDDALQWRVLRIFAGQDETEQARLAAQLSERSDRELFAAARDVLFYTPNVEGAARLSRLLVEPHRSAEARVAGHLLIAHIELAQGRWSGARRELAAAGLLNPAAALAFRTLLATTHFVPLARPELEALRDDLVGWGGSAVPNPYISWYSDLRPQTRSYLLGLLSVRLEDYGTALRYAEELERVHDGPAEAARGRAMAAAVRARAAFARGEPAEALAWLDAMRFEPSEALPLPPLAFFGHQRQLRPEALRHLNRPQEALRWYETLPWVSAVRAHTLLEVVHMAPWHLRQGELHERQGEREHAIRHYGRFVALWSDADPMLQPQVVEAQRRLAALQAR